MARIEKTIFISYRRTDVWAALAVYQSLSSKGYDVFFDYTSIPSGDFEQIILSNIKARAHFLLILTPTALDRCDEPGDWLRREIEAAIDEKRNIIPLFFKNFKFGTPSVAEKLTGKLASLNRYNGRNVHEDYFPAAMDRLSEQFLDVPLETVLLPISTEVRKVVREEQIAADKALEQKKNVIDDLVKPASVKIKETQVADFRFELLKTIIKNVRVGDLAFSPDGSLIALTILYGGPNLGIFHTASGELLPFQTEREGWRTDFYVAFSSDGSLIASSGNGGTRLWSTKNGTIRHQFKEFSRIALSSNSKLLAVHDESLSKIYRIEDGALIKQFDDNAYRPFMGKIVNKAINPNSSHRYNAISFSPDDSLLASVYDGKVNLWTVKDAVLLRRFETDNHVGRYIAFSPDGALLAVGGYYKKDGWSKGVAFEEVRIFWANNGDLIHAFKCSESWDSNSTSVSFSPDGNLLASGGKDGIRVWSIKTGELISKLESHPSQVYCISFSPDGNLLAAGGEDGLRVWKLSDFSYT